MGYGQQHLRVLLEAEAAGRARLERVAVASRAEAAEVLAPLEARGVEVFEDWREMLNPARGTLDAVFLPTPIHWHAEMTLAALAVGADVLVEKPLAGSLVQAGQMVAAAKAAGRRVAVGFQEVSTPLWCAVREGLAAGRLGTVQEVRGHGLWARTSHYYGRNNWAGRAVIDGRPVFDSPLNNALAHFVHLLLVLAGSGARTARVTDLVGECWRAQDIETYDTAAFRAETDTGVPIAFAATHSCGEHENPTIRIIGTGGELVWQLGRGLYGQWADGSPAAMPDPQDKSKRDTMMAAFLNWLDGDATAPVCTLESAAAHVELIEKLAQVAPARAVAPARVRRFALEDGGEQRMIEGVEAAVRSVSATGQPFAGAALGWAG